MGVRQHFCSFRGLTFHEFSGIWSLKENDSSKNIFSDIHGFNLCLLMSYVFVRVRSPWWFSKSGQDDPNSLEANDILCLFEAHGGSKDSVLGEARQGLFLCFGQVRGSCLSWLMVDGTQRNSSGYRMITLPGFSSFDKFA